LLSGGEEVTNDSPVARSSLRYNVFDMRANLSALLASGQVLLADGATGTNYFEMGLEAGEPPEFWNFDQPERVQDLHRRFVQAGADIILTNTFGCNRHRLKLHKAEGRVFEIAKRAAELAREVADLASRPVIVAGSVGPTGELFTPLGAMTEVEAVDTFAEQIEGLKAGGADVAWIETKSAIEEIRAAAMGAIRVGMPYTVTCSFDTAGRTMMGVPPAAMASLFEGLDVQPIAMGANCGVGAPDILVSLLEMTDATPGLHFISKSNCGVPQFRGAEIYYSGSPELMGTYAQLARAAGASIIGGCCGTSPDHLAAMRTALDIRALRPRPSVEDIIELVGPLMNSTPQADAPKRERGRRRGEPSAV
jgi:5-methyltetrahydrofolate--homocysteine methyltransferase